MQMAKVDMVGTGEEWRVKEYSRLRVNACQDLAAVSEQAG